MRSALAGAVAILALVLAARVLHGLQERAVERRGGGSFVMLVSRGLLLPASSSLDPGDQVDAAILAGDRTLGPRDGAEGLLVQAFDRVGEPSRRAQLGILRDVEPLRAFADQVEVGGFLALAHLGRIAEPAAGFEAFAAELGARALDRSWGLLTERTRDGWRALAESSSSTSGVTIASHLPSASRLPVSSEREQLVGPGLVTLSREHPRAAVGSRFLAAADFQGSVLEAWETPAVPGTPVPVLTWSNVPLGQDPRLTFGVAVRTGGSAVRATVTPSRGEARSWIRELPAARAGAWLPFEIGLEEFAGQVVEIEFACAASSGTTKVYFGRPTLTYRSE